MNAKVEKQINGLTVSAKPIYKEGVLPAYWTCVINERIIGKTFSSAREAFSFVRNIKRH